MSRRSSIWLRKEAEISIAFFRVTPLSWESRSGSCSRMSRVSRPKRSTIRWAVAGPTPRTTPEER